MLDFGKADLRAKKIYSYVLFLRVKNLWNKLYVYFNKLIY